MATAPTAPEEKFALTSSRHFPEWLARMGASLAFTTYQAGKLFFIGLKAEGRLAVFERTFARCMGLGVSADARVAVACDAIPAAALRQCRAEGRHARRARRGVRPARRLDHRRRRCPRCGARARRPAGLRQHAVRLRRHRERGPQLQAAVAAAVRQQARAGGPLPPQRSGAGEAASRATSRWSPIPTSPTAGATVAPTAGC